MKKFLNFAALVVLTVSSCTVFEERSSMNESQYNLDPSLMAIVEDGVLSFNSEYDLSQMLEAIRLNEVNRLNVMPMTKSGDPSFTSLRESLIEQGLREFTDEELAEIQARGLIYEPEDELIKDPSLIVVLNQDRQVKIGDNTYTFVPEGVVVTAPGVDVDSNDVADVGGNLEHGETAPVGDDGGYIIGIDYNDPHTPGDDSGEWKEPETDAIGGGGYTGGGNNGNNGSGNSRSASLELKDGITIPSSKIRRVSYEKGGGDGSWLTKLVNSIMSTSVLAYNYYDDKHRMVLKMYAQDYIIYRSVGMSLRMQERFLGVWWRKKADEFRYGWTNIECEYVYDAPNPFAPLTKSPDILTKNIDYFGQTTFYYVPFESYDVESGYIEDVVAAGLEERKSVKESYEDYRGTGFGSNKNSVYTIKFDKDKAYVEVVYPQGEEVAYNTGKEKVNWGYEWFFGNYTAGISVSGGGWSFEDLNIKSTSTQEIKRGRIYGAVKYNGEWRACVIETVD